MFNKRRTTSALAATAIGAMLLTACGATAAPGDSSEVSAEEFFAGKTVTWVIPFKAGGGTDVSARQLAPLLSKHLPGEPNVQIKNVEGAGSVLGANEYAAADPDGLSIMMTSASTTMPYLFGDPAVTYDFAEFDAIVGLPSGAVQYVSPSTGVKGADDLLDVERGSLIYGGVTPGGGEMPRLLGFHLLDVDVKTVFGYDSRATLQIAFQQGEVNLDGQTTQTFIENIGPLVEAGEAVPVYTSGMVVDGQLERDPAFGDLPHLKELVEASGRTTEGIEWDAYQFLIDATNNLQKPVWIHNDAPAVARDAYEQAFRDLEKSKEYEVVREGIGYDLLFGDELANSVKIVANPDPAVIEWLVNFAKTEYDADLSR